MNSWNFVGRLGRDAELKSVKDDQVLNFSVALDIGYGSTKSTLWVACALWGKRAAALAPCLRKGTQVGITGEAGARSYTKGDGSLGFDVTCRVGNVTLVGNKLNDHAQDPKPVDPPPAAGGMDDIPF